MPKNILLSKMASLFKKVFLKSFHFQTNLKFMSERSEREKFFWPFLGARRHHRFTVRRSRNFTHFHKSRELFTNFPKEIGKLIKISQDFATFFFGQAFQEKKRGPTFLLTFFFERPCPKKFYFSKSPDFFKKFSHKVSFSNEPQMDQRSSRA